MSVFLFALALLTAETPAAAQAASEPAPAAESPAIAPAGTPPGAPSDDYGLVAWCYGTLGGYLDLHDEVMPEVTRIESTYRKPGSRLEDDLKVYADLQKESRENLALFARAIAAAEKASLRPISTRGAEAVRKGRAVWTAASTISKARVAQEWMSWSLPAVCVSTAKSLETRANLLGATFDPAETGEATAPADEASPDVAAPPEATVAASNLEPVATSVDDGAAGDESPAVTAPDEGAPQDEPPSQAPVADNRLLAPSDTPIAPEAGAAPAAAISTETGASAESSSVP